MKKSRFTARLLCSIIVLAMIAAAVPAKTVEAAPRAATKYVYQAGHEGDVHYRTGIQSIVIGNKTYYDIANGSSSSIDITNENAFLKSVMTNKATAVDADYSPLQYWAIVAEQIFASNAKYCGATNDGDFEEKFTKETEANLSNGHANISDELSDVNKNEGNHGDRSKDNTRWTGWSHATSLKDLRQKTADYAANSINRYFDGSDFFSNTDGDDTLKNLSDDKERDVYYTMVSALDRVGITPKYHYNVWGLAFYDFELTTLTSNGINYVTAAQAYDDLEEAANDQVEGVKYDSTGKNHTTISYFENKSKESADVEASFEQESSLTASNTLETGNEYHYTEGIESESKFAAQIPLFGGIEETLHISFSAEQVVSTAYSTTHEVSDSYANTVSSTISLPAQTAVGIESYDANTTITLNYDCPVAVTYKVAIFSLNGELYDDNSKTHHFDTAAYHQKYFSTIFGSKSASGGTNAIDNLYNRAIAYTNINNYDKDYGSVKGWSHKRGHAADSVDQLNWTNILGGIIPEESVEVQKNDIIVHRYSVSASGQPQEELSSYILKDQTCGYENTIDIVDPYTFYSGGTSYIGHLYTDPVVVDDYNRNGDFETTSAPYRKTAVASSEAEVAAAVASDPNNASILNHVYLYYQLEEVQTNNAATGALALPDASYTPADSGNLPMKIGAPITAKQCVEWLSVHYPMSVDGGVVTYTGSSMNSNINGIVPLYPLTTIQVANNYKTLNMIEGDTFDLGKVLLEGYNENDVPFYGFNQEKGRWVLCQPDGTEIAASDIASIATDENTSECILTAGSAEGSLYVKYVIDEDCYKAKNQIDYTANTDLTSTAMIKINVTNKPFDGTVVASGTTSTFVGDPALDLLNTKGIKAYVFDASGKKISNAPLHWEAQLDDEDGVVMSDDEVSFTQDGTFKFRATYRGKYSDWIEIKVLPKRALASLVIEDNNDPALLADYILHDGDDSFDLSKLTVGSFDQYENEYALDNDVTWNVLDSKGQPVAVEADGKTLLVTEADTYSIYASYTEGSNTVESNRITFNVLAQRHLETLTISDENDPALLADYILHDGTDTFDLTKLTAAGLDQYDAAYDTSDVIWAIDETEGAAVDINGQLTVSAAGEYHIYAYKAKGDGTAAMTESNRLTFNVLPARELVSLAIASDITETGIGVGEAYQYDLAGVTVTALDQYDDPWDYTKDTYEWIIGGNKAEYIADKEAVRGLVLGEATLTLKDGEISSNTITFNVINMPYVKELYTTDTSLIREGEIFDLTTITLTARDQFGEVYNMSQAEMESIVWEITDKGTVKSTTGATLDPAAKTLTVAEGTLNYGETGNVIVQATFTNPRENLAVSVQAEITVQQNPILDALTLAQTDPDAVLETEDNAYCDEFFTITGTDQYGKDFDLTGVTFTYYSDNPEAFKIEDTAKGATITAGSPNTGAYISVSTVNSINETVTSNRVDMNVPRVPVLTSIELTGAPKAIAFNTKLEMKELQATCFDELNEAFTPERLAKYPAKVSYTLDEKATDTRFDTRKELLTTGSKYGYITIAAMAVNSSTTKTIQREGQDVTTSVDIWVGPYVESVTPEIPEMIATAGDNTITLKGICLEDGMVVGLFDDQDSLVVQADTKGSDSKQEAVLDVPNNIGGAADKRYTVKYSIDGTTFMEAPDWPTAQLLVSNKIPATSVKLNKNTDALKTGKTDTLVATMLPDNTTDTLTWKSSDAKVVTVDADGKITGVKAGTATITVTTTSGCTDTCKVAVGLAKGAKINDGLYTYEVTNDKVDGTGTMKVTGFVKGKSTAKVKIPATKTKYTISYKVTAIGDKAFMNKKMITYVYTGKNVKTIGAHAFDGCKKMTTATVSASVSRMKSWCFYNCYALKTVTIGKNVEYMGPHCLCNNNKIKKLVFKTTKLTKKKIGSPHVLIRVRRATVYFPASSFKAYKKMFNIKTALKGCKFRKLK